MQYMAEHNWQYPNDHQFAMNTGSHQWHDPVTSLNDPNDPSVSACMAEGASDVPTQLTWSDLWNPTKIQAMIKHDIFLHASPEDLTAIVLFFELTKMAKGQPIHLEDIPNDFRDSLPCKWQPAYNAVTAQVPHPIPLAPVPDDFIQAPNYP
jgi:hypothetical protein